MEKINILISIGSACRTRHQIDKHMQFIEKNHQPNSYYFDWLMLGGLSGVQKTIENNFTICKDDISAIKLSKGWIPCEKSSGFVFLHDFGMNNEFATSLEECQEKIEKNQETTLEKYQYLGKKTNAIFTSEKNIGLVYHGEARAIDFIKLQNTLRKKYNKYFLIINIVESGTLIQKNIKNLISLTVEDNKNPLKNTPREWEGWDHSWRNAFLNLKIEP